ncbi:MAG: aminopeptidase P family protein [Polyangiaceae bacterium]
MSFPVTTSGVYRARRGALAARYTAPAVFFAGAAPARNYPANTYAFRPNSHYAYFGGPAEEGAALLFDGGSWTLFAHPPDRDDALWHGARPPLASLTSRFAVDAVRPVDELGPALRALGAVASLSPKPHREGYDDALAGADSARAADLADSVIAVRLAHDEAAVAQLRAAAEASAEAHVAGMRATRGAATEHEVCAAITHALYRRGMADAYGPIVTIRGEVLHNHSHDGKLTPGDLLLCDVGGETPEGWASDITRTWPVSGTFSPTQKAIYEIVLAAQLAAIDRVRPGVRYRDAHEAAKRTIVEGLVGLGILRGAVDGLLERGAAALFFPHGIGHLLGLDVHDMEDLGDRAGYAPGRKRSERFGDRYLRLDRDLVAGMAVTIEPGFYQVPEILNDAELTKEVGADLDREALARFADVRGIRIEDDVLCTSDEPEILSKSCPKRVADVEAAVRG